ncbi:MAG: ribonuclease P protein component [Phycisphaeraceae bacterium]|nr:ribonuclease P protein component [Phycisphaeraceae bacterium]
MTGGGERPRRDERFGRDRRIRRREAFDAAWRGGSRHHAGPLVIVIRPNGLEVTRLGVAVARRVGGAVLRNRIRRRLRETFRTMRPDLPPGLDIVVQVKPHAPLLEGADLRDMIARAVRQAVARGGARPSAPENRERPAGEAPA